MAAKPHGFQRGLSLHERGLYQAAAQEYGRALLTAVDPETRAQLWNRTTAAYLELGLWDEATEASAQAMLEVAQVPRRHRLQFIVRFNRHIVLAVTGRFSEADELASELEGLTAAVPLTPNDRAAMAHMRLYAAVERGDLARVGEHSEDLDRYASLGSRYRLALHQNLGIAAMYEGRLDDARRYLSAACQAVDHQTTSRERLKLAGDLVHLAILEGSAEGIAHSLSQCTGVLTHDPASVDEEELARLSVQLGAVLLAADNELDGQRLVHNGLTFLRKWNRAFEADHYEERLSAMGRLRIPWTARLVFLKRLLAALPLPDLRLEPGTAYAGRLGGLLHPGLDVSRAQQITAWAGVLPEYGSLLENRRTCPEARVARLLRAYSRDLLSGRSYREVLVRLLIEDDLDSRTAQRFVALHVA